MKRPLLQDEEFIADVEAAGGRPEALHAWWLGQSGFLVRHGARAVLFDPYLSDSLTAKYAGTDNPHVRMTGRVVAPESLTGIDVVTSSHNHTDHLDRETLVPLIGANPGVRMVIPEANREFVAGRLDVDPAWPVGLDDGESVEVGGVPFHGLPAAHDELETDDHGRHRFMGYVVELGPWTVYHSGDTGPYDGLVERLRSFDIDLGFLPINGRAPERRVAGNLDAAEAVAVARDAGIRMVVPHHFDMFTFNTADPAEFAAEAAGRGQPATVLRNGERITIEPP